MVARVSSRRCLAESETGAGSRDDRQPGRWQILRLGAQHQGPVFFKQAGACQAGPIPAGQDFFQLGEPLDPASFVAFRPE